MKHVFLDANVFIHYQFKKEEFTKLIKFLKKMGLIPSTTVYTVIELKTNKNAKKSLEILTRNDDIKILLTEIKGLNPKLYTKKELKNKYNIKKYKEQKRLYEGSYILYIDALMVEFIKCIFDSEKDFIIEKEKIDLSFKNFDDKKKANKYLSEYFQKIKKYLLEFYNENNYQKEVIKQKMRSKKNDILKQILDYLKKQEIENQTDELIEITARECYDKMYKIIASDDEKIDKNDFFDLLFTTIISEKQFVMTKDKGILRTIEKFNYKEILKYEGFKIMGIYELNNIMCSYLKAKELNQIFENFINKI